MPGHTTMRILVVDDDARVRDAVRALIDASQGLSVCGEASSGPEAIRADEELVPDVVVLDLLLPAAKDGLDVLARLVRTGRRVIALSLDGALRDAALDAGAVVFIDKGAGPDRLIQALRSVPAWPPDVTG